jgi:competence protein ComEC
MQDSPYPFRGDILTWYFPAYAGGLFLAPYCAPPKTCVMLLAATTILIISVLNQRLKTFFFMCFLAFSGFVFYHLSMGPPGSPAHVAHLTGKKVILEGHVNSITPRPQGSLLDLETTASVSSKRIISRRGRIHLFIREGTPAVFPGDKVRVSTFLRRPGLYGVPGEFNYPRHLARQHVYVIGSVDSALRVVRIAGARRQSLRDLIEGFRHSIRSFIIENSPDMAPYLRALTIGDRSGLSSEEKGLLGRSGVSHLFAISGMHMGIIFVFLYSAFGFCYKRSETLLLLAPPRRLLPLLIAPALLFYLFLAGGGLPTQRAFAVLVAASLLLFWHYHVAPMHIAFGIAFLLILMDPLAFFSASYQLSFAAVFAILFFTPRWQRFVPRRPRVFRYIVVLFFVTSAATAATLPLVIFHFHVLPWSGLLLNLICVPLVSFAALPCALAGAAFSTFFPILGQAFFAMSATVLKLTLDIIRFLTPAADSAWSGIYLSPFETSSILLFFLAFFLWKKGPLRGLLLGGIILAACGFLLFYPRIGGKPLTLTAVNVGHGDALVLQKEDAVYLIDGGGSYNDNFDVGARLFAPALGHMGIREIEAVVLTHAHPDHFKGLGYILTHFQVKGFWSAIPREKLPPMIRAPLTSKGIPVTCFPEGWTAIQQGSTGAFYLFVPNQETPVVNDRSLALFLKDEKNSLLLTGDLEVNGVQQLLQNPVHPRATLLKLPHHGSIHSQPARLIDFFKPEILFATTNRLIPGTAYYPAAGHPPRIHTCVFPGTGKQASLRFVAGKDGWRVEYWQRGLFR